MALAARSYQEKRREIKNMSEVKNNDENKKSKGHLYKILACVFAVGFVVATGFAIRDAYYKWQMQKQYEALAEMMAAGTKADASADRQTDGTEQGTDEQNETAGTEMLEGTETDETEVEELSEIVKFLEEHGTAIPEKKLDWDALAEENEHIYAWIYIPGTNVDYPMVQHPENVNYYLDHNLDHSSGLPGCIYTENFNSKDFTDPNTVIYGHNMKNGSMFATLHKFEDKAFFEENRFAYIYTPDRVLVYDIFAAYEFSNLHLMLSFDFETKESFELYLSGIREINDMNSHHREETEVTGEDRIITMSTCIGNKPNNRWIVAGVLIGEETIEE